MATRESQGKTSSTRVCIYVSNHTVAPRTRQAIYFALNQNPLRMLYIPRAFCLSSTPSLPTLFIGNTAPTPLHISLRSDHRRSLGSQPLNNNPKYPPPNPSHTTPNIPHMADFDNASQAFLAWLRQSGAEISPRIKLADLRNKDAGRGVGK